MRVFAAGLGKTIKRGEPRSLHDIKFFWGERFPAHPKTQEINLKATAEEIKYERRVKEAYRTYDRAFATAPQAWQERLQAG